MIDIALTIIGIGLSYLIIIPTYRFLGNMVNVILMILLTATNETSTIIAIGTIFSIIFVIIMIMDLINGKQ